MPVPGSAYIFKLSVPSIGAMPLQYQLVRLTLISYLFFQSPQSGQCLCNRTRRCVTTSVRTFQSPQSGQCLCNGFRHTWSSSRTILSVPSIGAMPLQCRSHATDALRSRIFQSPQSGQCLCNAVHRAVIALACCIFQSPQSGQCLCNCTL